MKANKILAPGLAGLLCVINQSGIVKADDKTKAPEATVAPKSAEANTAADAVVAVFNGRKITMAEIDKQLRQKPMFAYYLQQNQGNPEKMKQLRISAINALINRELLLAAAKASGTVSEEEVKKSVDMVIANYGGQEKLDDLLASIQTDFKTFTNGIGDDFRINQYLENSLGKAIQITPEEIKAAFDQNPQRYAQEESVRARHILIKVDKNANEKDQKAAEKTINELYEQVSKPGADFGEVAKGKSQCPSAPKGGDLGFFKRKMMVPEFEKAAFELKPGEISKPVRTQYGWHIIKVEEKKETKPATIESAKTVIEQELKNKKKEALLQSKVAELRKSAQIEFKI